VQTAVLITCWPNRENVYHGSNHQLLGSTLARSVDVVVVIVVVVVLNGLLLLYTFGIICRL
jgi:hypothetical protein